MSLHTLTQEQRKALKSKIDEISNSMTRVEAERDLVKDIYEGIKDEFEIAPKVARKIAKTYHKRNIHEVVADAEELEEIYTELFPTI